MYEYRAHIIKIVDGDTVDVDIDLGFGIVLSNERVRINGIDTPESRTTDKEEKKFGLAAKARLKSLLGKTCTLKTQINKSGEDMKGKFGRILGDFDVYDATTDSWRPVTSVLVNEGHAVLYHGQAKADVQEAHMANRARLLKEGIVK
jgi:micrococcal nuclease|tara:strand:+ start:899 stop:1339 length:441 start_codon:yes stop_codon:yes gene_type:complete